MYEFFYLSSYCIFKQYKNNEDNSPNTLVCPSNIQWKRFERLNQKLAWMTKQLTFPYRCRDLKLVPPGLILKLWVKCRRAQKEEGMSWSEIEYIITAGRNINYSLKSQASLPHSWIEYQIKDRTQIQQYQDKSYKQKFHNVK